MFDPKKGGLHLAVVRGWIQRKARNGERVIWGSDEILNVDVTPRKLEDLAVEIAKAVLSEIVTVGDIQEAWRQASRPRIALEAKGFLVRVSDGGEERQYLDIGSALESIFRGLKPGKGGEA